ncbi:MAG TPA: DUF998 domain-containing protein [Microlunatus sp.]|nr:DUF998 domain-containing protein [Microlunatus sp.]
MTTTTGRAHLLRRSVLLGAGCWLLTVLYLAVEPIVASAAASYSFAGDTISLLGITECVPAGEFSSRPFCSPWHAGLNGAFVVRGALTVAGAVLLRALWPRRPSTWVGLALIIVAGLSTLATGLFPLTAGLAAHSVAALPQFPAEGVGMTLLGVAARRDDRPVALISLVCGITTLVGLVLFLGATPLGLPIGVTERIAFYPVTVWTTVVAALVLRRRTADPAR